jgi:hypothetical protein
MFSIPRHSHCVGKLAVVKELILLINYDIIGLSNEIVYV